MSRLHKNTWSLWALFMSPLGAWAQQPMTQATQLLVDSAVVVDDATESAHHLAGKAECIDGKKINHKEHITHPIDVIKGQVAGMQVERGGANALNAVRLRGTTSLAGGNNPLIIVNGVMGDLTLLQSIYPTDIESFTILKDASETSQYGSRGAAGVIEIKTLGGADGRMKVNYNALLGCAAVYKTPHMLSGDDYRRYAASQGIDVLDRGANTDFMRRITRNAFSQQHHLAFYGGTEQGGYRVSLGYIDNQNIIKDRGERTFMSHMNASQTMFDGVLKIDLGMFGSSHAQEGIADEQKLFYSAAAINPTFPADASYGYPSASQINNPLALLDMLDDTEGLHLNTHAKLRFDLLPRLHFTLFGSYSYDVSEEKQYFPNTVWNKGQAYRATCKQRQVLGNAKLDYQLEWAQRRHQLDILALAEFQQNRYTGYHTTVTNFAQDTNGYDDLAGGALRPWNGTGSYYEEPHMASYMMRMGYNLLQRYNLTASVRADGSSKFGRNHKWGYFPSISGSWMVSDEVFMQSLTWIDRIKVNVGYGVTGNQAGIDSYTSLARFSASGVVPAGSASLVSFSQLKNVNPDLKWEVNRTFNAGLDAQLLKGRLVLAANYYNTYIDDMLYPYSVSVPPFAFSTLVANMGTMRNEGLEFSLGITPLVTRDMELNINANLTFQRNKLLSLGGEYNGEKLVAADVQALASMNGAGFHGGYNDVTYQIVGYSLGTFFMPRSTGLVQNATGGYSYGVVDADKNGTIDLGADRCIVGQATPKVLFGSNVSFRYKDFDVSIQLNGAFGHKIFNGTALSYMNVTSFPLYNIMADAPAANIQDQTVTDYWLERGDYVNIDYISLGWQVPVARNRFIENMRLSLTMNNVATFTAYSGLTPMINSSNVNSTLGLDDKRSYPLYHTYTIGVSMNF